MVMWLIASFQRYWRSKNVQSLSNMLHIFSISFFIMVRLSWYFHEVQLLIATFQSYWRSKNVQSVSNTYIFIYIYIFIIHIVFLLRGYQFFYHSPIIMIYILSSLLFPEISFVHLFTLISNITIQINVSVDTFIGISIQ